MQLKRISGHLGVLSPDAEFSEFAARQGRSF